MVNKYYKENKEKIRKEACKNIKIFLKTKKTKGEKWSETDNKIFPKNKSRNYLSI